MRTFELTGRGLAAGPTGIPAGEVALRIPLRLVLTSRALPQHTLLDGLHEDLRLAIALLHEPVRDPQGPWARYTLLLPTSPPSALGWTPRAARIPSSVTAAHRARTYEDERRGAPVIRGDQHARRSGASIARARGGSAQVNCQE